MNILMVCLGNICRSPIASALLQQKCNHFGLNWNVDSAGTANYHVGAPAHESSQKVCLEHNIHNISMHKARQFSKSDLKHYDLIFAMDSENFSTMQRLCENDSQRQKIKLILNELRPGLNEKVPDPWYGDYSDFKAVFQMLDEATDAILNHYAKDFLKKV